MKIVTVIPLERSPMQGDLTYFTSKDITQGSIVTVPLRSKKILGLVSSCEDASEAKGNIKDLEFNLKKVLDVKEDSIFRKEFIEAALDTSKYFATTPNNGLDILIPNILKNEYDKVLSWQNKLKSIAAKEDEKKIRAEKLLLQMPFEERLSIYKTLIRENFASKKSVFIVLPTENDISHFYESLSKGIGQFIIEIHGGLTPKKTMEAIEKITTSSHPVLVIATAPYLSIKRKDLGLIILEHESSPSYKVINRTHFDLRIFAETFASKIGARFILSDTLLRFETIGRGELDHLNPMHSLSYRIDFDGEIEILGRRSPKDNPRDTEKFKILLPEAIKDIQSTLARKKNVFIFSLRKGLATMTVCRDCESVLSCDKCGSPAVLYTSQSGTKRMFVCNKCKKALREDTFCKVCGGWNLVALGVGTETVLAYVKDAFPKTRIFKFDKESIKTKKEAEKIIKEFEESDGAILVGTEMALLYLKERVSLSLIASFDSFWSIPNYKISEKIVQLIISMATQTKDKIIIQTKNDKDEAITSIQRGNLLNFIRSELKDREVLSYPPYKRFIKITHLGDKEQTVRAKTLLKEMFAEYMPEVFSGFLAKQKGKYITNALIKTNIKNWSLQEISTNSSIDENLLKMLLSLPPQFEIFVDPEDLL